MAFYGGYTGAPSRGSYYPGSGPGRAGSSLVASRLREGASPRGGGYTSPLRARPQTAHVVSRRTSGSPVRLRDGYVEPTQSLSPDSEAIRSIKEYHAQRLTSPKSQADYSYSSYEPSYDTNRWTQRHQTEPSDLGRRGHRWDTTSPANLTSVLRARSPDRLAIRRTSDYAGVARPSDQMGRAAPRSQDTDGRLDQLEARLNALADQEKEATERGRRAEHHAASMLLSEQAEEEAKQAAASKLSQIAVMAAKAAVEEAEVAMAAERAEAAAIAERAAEAATAAKEDEEREAKLAAKLAHEAAAIAKRAEEAKVEENRARTKATQERTASKVAQEKFAAAKAAEAVAAATKAAEEAAAAKAAEEAAKVRAAQEEAAAHAASEAAVKAALDEAATVKAAAEALAAQEVAAAKAAAEAAIKAALDEAARFKAEEAAAQAKKAKAAEEAAQAKKAKAREAEAAKARVKATAAAALAANCSKELESALSPCSRDLQRVTEEVEAVWVVAGPAEPQPPGSPTNFKSQSVTETLQLLNEGHDWPHAEAFVASKRTNQWYRLAKQDGPPGEVTHEEQPQTVDNASLPAVDNPVFQKWVMGGEDRVEMLRKSLMELSQRGVRSMVLTNGFDDDADAVLQGVGAADYFDAVCGTQPTSMGGGHITLRAGGDTARRMPFPGWKSSSVHDRYNKVYVMDQLLMDEPPEWVSETFGGRVDGVVYIDDNLETRGGPNLLSLELPREGKGLEREHFEQIHQMVSKLPGQHTTVCVFDFDCTLSQFHMFKVMNQAQSGWRTSWNSYLQQTGLPAAPAGWRPQGRAGNIAERHSQPSMRHPSPPPLRRSPSPIFTADRSPSPVMGRSPSPGIRSPTYSGAQGLNIRSPNYSGAQGLRDEMLSPSSRARGMSRRADRR